MKITVGAQTYKNRPDGLNLEYVLREGGNLFFPSIDGDAANMRRFVTFLGDKGKAGYLENFNDSGLMDKNDVGHFLHYGKPGGPSRVLYLSSIEPRENPIGFILANGEKNGSKIYIDTNWLLRMPNPSRLRSTLIVAPCDNRWVIRTSSQFDYRPIRF
ncbi:hypothetical protein KGQ31_01255 [Patescibacteria group bacterium]|nr:hypothetical protein [Patescibacteria group bacterium]